MPTNKPTLETCKSFDDEIVSPKYIKVDIFYDNLSLLKTIQREIQHITNLAYNFQDKYKICKKYLHKDYIEMITKDINKHFTDIYKIINLSYTEPLKSAFNVDYEEMSWYCEIAKTYYLENETSKTNLVAIYEHLLEIATTIDALNIEIQDKYEFVRS